MKEKGEIQAFLAKFWVKNEDSRFPDHSLQAKRAVREEETSLERAGCSCRLLKMTALRPPASPTQMADYLGGSYVQYRVAFRLS
ncbi:hypothetical protein D5086_026920 [Populus alba]|uniref:Uncharacterized protein n=1 Tax=Populus alba TaxID=43335 RepID=A0ACC4B3S9_POPAL